MRLAVGSGFHWDDRNPDGQENGHQLPHVQRWSGLIAQPPFPLSGVTATRPASSGNAHAQSRLSMPAAALDAACGAADTNERSVKKAQSAKSAHCLFILSLNYTLILIERARV